MELKFGHRVIGWNFSNDKTRGFFICNDGDDKTPYSIYDPHLNHIHWVNNVELDPEATEFLPGDEVEMSDNGEDWIETTYQHPDPHGFGHYDDEGDMYRLCRYPSKDSLNGKVAIIDGKEYKLRLK